MEEKKLTDEEIVKALEICYSSPCCTNECPYFNKHGRNFCVEDKALYKDMKRIVQEHAEQKAEIERLTEDYEDRLCTAGNVYQVALDEKAELQKQVDELKTEKEDLYFQNQNLQTYIDNHETIWKRNSEQAVKDTAKEILEELIEKAYSSGCIDLNVNEVKAWFREDYGVEVE